MNGFFALVHADMVRKLDLVIEKQRAFLEKIDRAGDELRNEFRREHEITRDLIRDLVRGQKSLDSPEKRLERFQSET